MTLATMGLTTDEQKAVEQFRNDVVAPSMEKLVIVDFWAEWCGPCKQLTPVLEKVAEDYADKGVVLAKVNVDENKFIASQFQVRSIPTVYAMFQGQPIADMSGARTEPQIAEMLDQLLAKLPVKAGDGTTDPAAEVLPLLEAAEELLDNDGAEQAYGLFADALILVPDHPPALSGLIRAMVALGRQDEAQVIFDSFDETIRTDPLMEKAGLALSIAAAGVEPDALIALKNAVSADPDDHEKQFELANALMAAGDREGAADALLHSIAADRAHNDGAAKARLLEIFALIGLEDPWVAATRRRLSAILFG
jgi:putative thioredoxin